MARAPQPEIRERLLDACTEYSLAHGLPDGVEPLSRASGASARMLLYHFGTRDDLLRAILRRARERQVALFGALLAPVDGVPYAETLHRAWAEMSGAEAEPYLRMFGQLRESAEQRLWPGFRRLATEEWIAPLEDGLRSVGRPELATLVLAVIRGLLMDLDATADRARADAAFQAFLEELDLPARRV